MQLRIRVSLGVRGQVENRKGLRENGFIVPDTVLFNENMFSKEP